MNGINCFFYYLFVKNILYIVMFDYIIKNWFLKKLKVKNIIFYYILKIKKSVENLYRK